MSAEELIRHRSASQGSHNSVKKLAPSRSKLRSKSVLGICAATGSLFLFTRGPTVVCLHHDTLAVERYFENHREDILLLSVDNASAQGGGRLAVTYDVGQTAIVWDMHTGQEIARFASFEHINVANWMRNGNVAFGNSKGNIILFEPSTSEHLSTRTIFDPITALAPSSDCKTFAIGYMNGSILIATVQPTFTILHTLTTSRAPSPLVHLAWHASSSKQKASMLASQTMDGDLRVWSIPKQPSSESPRVIRALTRPESCQPGRHWLGWSKNGRIVQFSEGEVVVWDVRTKHVTYETVPIAGDVCGITNYGPTATLFTLSRDDTVQQYELSPPTLVASVRHLPATVPAPPRFGSTGRGHSSTGLSGNTPVTALRSEPESEEDSAALTPLQKIVQEMAEMEADRKNRIDTTSSMSSALSRTGSASSRSSGGRYRPGYPSKSSISAKSSDVTFLSNGTMSYGGADSVSISSSSSFASSHRIKRPGSRLKHELLRSPEANKVVDIFSYTKSKLEEVPYTIPSCRDESHLTPDDLRRQTLRVVFGWHGDIEDLIKDELTHQPPGSPAAVLLSKWITDVDEQMMKTMVGSESMTASDWMLLALSQIGGQASTKKVGQAFVQRLLEKGDVHSSVTILLGLGDQEDAVEVYVSRNYFLEAVLLTCLIFPTDWQRLSHLLRRWGEYAITSSQQQLALRCFSCTSIGPCESWTPPTRRQSISKSSNIQHLSANGHHHHSHNHESSLKSPALANQSLSPTQVGQVPKGVRAPGVPPVPIITGPPLSPPGTGNPNRLTTKNAALKVITSFPSNQVAPGSYFSAITSDDRTPMNNIGVTPIADTALSNSPGAWLRPHGRGSNPSSARRTPGGYGRKRLPSIGETPVDVTPHPFAKPTSLATIVDSLSAKEKQKGNGVKSGQQDSRATLSATKYDPKTKDPRSQTSPSHKLYSPVQGSFANPNGERRDGPRNMKGEEVQVQWPPIESILTGDYISTTSARSSDAYASNRGNNFSSANSTPSISSRHEMRSRSIDQFISSLEEANYYSRRYRSGSRHRQESRDRKPRLNIKAPSDARMQSQDRQTEFSEGRGRRDVRYMRPKKSPSSPVPMSPEDLKLYPRCETADAEKYYRSTSPNADASQRSQRSQQKSHSKTRSKASATSNRNAHEQSQERRAESQNAGKRAGSAQRKAGIHQENSMAHPPKGDRGRSRSRGKGKPSRSPSSPVPMSTEPNDMTQAALTSTDEVSMSSDYLSPARRYRSGSRQKNERGSSARRDPSPDRRRRYNRSQSRQAREDEAFSRVAIGGSSAEQHRHGNRTDESDLWDSDADLKRQMAAQELEDRRKSLSRRPSVPFIPHPEELAKSRPPVVEICSAQDIRDNPNAWIMMSRWGIGEPRRSKSVSSQRRPTFFDPNSSIAIGIGLPPTPKAMPHPLHSNKVAGGSSHEFYIPDVPDNLSMLPSAFSEEGTGEFPNHLKAGIPDDIMGRSMSAPIPDRPLSPGPLPSSFPTHPAFLHNLPPSKGQASGQQGHAVRKIAPGESEPGQLGFGAAAALANAALNGLDADEAAQAANNTLKPEDTNRVPSAPPLLAELQHLKKKAPPSLPLPPPPPPVPPKPAEYSQDRSVPDKAGNAVGVINIAMEDKEAGIPTEEEASKSATAPAVKLPQSQSQSQLQHDAPAPPQLQISTQIPPAAANHTLRSPHRRGQSTQEATLSSKMKNALSQPLPRGNPPLMYKTGRRPREFAAAMHEGGMI